MSGPNITVGDKFYDEKWEGVSTVTSVEDEVVTIRASNGTHHVEPKEQLLDTSHIHHWPRGRGIHSGERSRSLALDMVHNLDGVGEDIAKSLVRELTVPEIALGATEAYHHGQTERFELVEGIGPATAEKIAEWLKTRR